jgi:dual specificity tyrosine-phosphorylation-regulated kinase 2/3/4
MEKDPEDTFNIVRLMDEFYFRDHHCFVFELLETDLFEYMKENDFAGFSLNRIKNIAAQILHTLTFLEKNELIHCDLKPENILITDKKTESLKLVDYGSGCFVSEQVYTYVQSRFYRAPEVILRLPYTEKVDIWSFGCILMELYTGEPLFPGNNEQE